MSIEPRDQEASAQWQRPAQAQSQQHAAALERLVRFYETISLTSVRTGLGDIYAGDARFKDPFNEVAGLDAIGEIFEHMFDQVGNPRFVVKVRVLQDGHAFITWDFLFFIKRMPAREQCVRGATHLEFDAVGKVSLHRDYWDVAEELYEKLPVLGGLMRLLKRLSNR